MMFMYVNIRGALLRGLYFILYLHGDLARPILNSSSVKLSQRTAEYLHSLKSMYT